MNETIEKSMDLLLNHFWITKDQDKEDYYYIKSQSAKLKEFITKNLGSKLIIHDRFIKLEKIPAVPMKSMGIPTFIEQLDYILLMLMLLYLEDKARGERFMLSSITEYLKNTSITLELNHVPDWTLTSNRRSLVRVLNYLVGIHVLILNDKDKRSFEESEDADALYEVTGISNYVVPTFYQDMEELNTSEDFLKQEWFGQSEEKGDVRRYKVYRHLLYAPASPRYYWTSAEEDYFKKIYNAIKKEIRENLGFQVEITKNLAMVYAEETNIEKNYFPNTKKLSDIVLMVNQEIVNYANIHNVEYDEKECFTISKIEFTSVLEKVRNQKAGYFSKEYLDLNFSKYVQNVLDYMEAFQFVKEDTEEIIIFPTIYRFLGKTIEKQGKTVFEEMTLEEVCV